MCALVCISPIHSLGSSCHYRAWEPCSHCALQRGEGSEVVIAQGQDSGCLLAQRVSAQSEEQNLNPQLTHS